VRGVASVTVSSKYQVVIPKDVRQRANIRPGQKLCVLVKGRTISLVPVPPVGELFGFAPGINLADIRDEEDDL